MNKLSINVFYSLEIRTKIKICCALALLGIVIFGNHLHNSLQFDSVLYVKNNVNIHNPEKIINWEFILKEYRSRGLTRISIAINAILGKVNPFGYHLFNLTVHTLNTILIFFVTLEAFRYFGLRFPIHKNSKASFIGFLTSVGFLCHPLQTESVVYIVSRSGLLAATVYLTGFLLFQRFLNDQKCKSLLSWLKIILLIVAFTIVGFGFKQSVITLPAIIFFYWLLGLPSDSKAIQEFKKFKWPTLGFFILFLSILMWKLMTNERFLIGPSTAGEVIGRLNYMLSQPIVVIFYYFKLFLFPFNLNIDPDILFGTFSLKLLTSIAFILAPLWIFLTNKNLRIYFFGLSWFYIVISPSSSIITLLDLGAEHRVYLGIFGLFFIIAILGSQFVHQFTDQTVRFRRKLLIISCVIFLCLTTIKRNSVWNTEETLWIDTLKKSPNKTRAWINLGRAKTIAGRPQKAIYYYENAIKLDPNFFQTQFNLGSLYYQQGRFQEALANFIRASILAPRLPEPVGRVGETYLALKNYKMANDFLKKAVEIDPNYATAFRNLGVVNYYYLKNKREGLIYFKRSLDLNPKQPGIDQVIMLLKLEKVL
jgi:protein O-mannosyl-transferase